MQREIRVFVVTFAPALRERDAAVLDMVSSHVPKTRCVASLVCSKPFKVCDVPWYVIIVESVKNATKGADNCNYSKHKE